MCVCVRVCARTYLSRRYVPTFVSREMSTSLCRRAKTLIAGERTSGPYVASASVTHTPGKGISVRI